MRYPLVLLALAFSLSTSHAADPVRISDVRVGFVNGNNDYHKIGFWAPVIVQVENQIIGEEFEGAITVETTDSDGAQTRFSPRRVYLGKSEQRRSYLTYIKISGNSADIKVNLKGNIGKERYQHTFNYPGDRQDVRGNAVDPSQKLVLALGDPKGLELPTDEELAGRPEINRNWHVAFQTEVNLLPDKWFGYEGVDVVVLPTGGNWNNGLAQMLSNDQVKRAALAQWVEMGGHLVVSVAANHSFVGNPQSFQLEPLLPARIDTAGTVKVDRLEMVRELVDRRINPNQRFRAGAVKSFGSEVAVLRRRHPSLSNEETNPRVATIVHGSRGLGRITLLAFDTDQGPFAIWENRRDFWPALLELKPKLTDPNQNLTGFGGGGRFGFNPMSSDLAGQLCQQLETFGEVKVIPFAWVAIFIFVYILIVGPLDYLVLKKVVKRLEWTWITFPVVVLCVSIGAFFLAQYLKGNELRINKLDVVEIDTHTNLAHGTTWFTIFSPRLQHYDVGIETTGFDKGAEGTVVSWMGRPGLGARTLGGRAAGAGLFSRSYEFENEGQSLKGVPIQVWSMKTFTGRWQAALKPGQQVITHDLKQERALVEGSLTSHLPFTLRNCQVLFRGSVWNVGVLETGKPVKLPADYSAVKGLPQSWGPSTTAMPRMNRPYDQVVNTSLTGLVRQMMFFAELHRYQTGTRTAESEYLDFLDQSWRLEFPEAVLIGLLDEEDGSASDVNERERPGARLKPFEPRLRGTMRQTTVVRIYLPVAAPAANQ